MKIFGLVLSVVILQMCAGFTDRGEEVLVVPPTATVVFTTTASPTTATDTPVPTATATYTLTPTNTSTPTPIATPTKKVVAPPTSTVISQRGSVKVPILMYHYLSNPPDGADAIRRDLSVPPATFEAHLAWLRQAGYEAISLAELASAFRRRTPLPQKPIIISFDDGYRDNYDNAFPLLRQYGYTAVFFIFTQPIDTYNVSYLSWEMVTEMSKAGMEFGSHSYSHADLRNRDVDFLVYEILGSKEAIEERTGKPVLFFSYPAGKYDALTIQVVKSANFAGAVTTEWGATHSFKKRFEMQRVRIRGNDQPQDLANKLNSF